MNSFAYDMWFVSVGATLLAILVLLLLFWLLRTRHNIYAATLLIGIAFDKLTAVVGISLYINNGSGASVPDEFAWLRTAGAFVLLISLILYALHRFGVLNGVGSK